MAEVGAQSRPPLIYSITVIWYMRALACRYFGLFLLAVLPLYTIPAKGFAAGQQTRLGGEVGLYGELNSTSGREQRRPDALGRFFVRPLVTFANGAQLQFEIDLSTEGSSARQDINHFGFNPRWRWGEIYVGDFNLMFSPLTLSGVRVRGGCVALHTGKARITLLHGTTQREVSSPAENRAYQRSLSGVQLGVGRETGTSFALNILSVKDDISNLGEISTDSTVSVDSLTGDTTVNALSVTPQENLVVSAMTNLSLAHDQVVWKTEFSGTAITRDRRSAVLETSDVPDFLTNVFTPRVSSSADYAYTTEAQFNHGALGIQAAYGYIGPGYVSLGLASLSPDRRTADLGFRYRFKPVMMRLNYQRQSNNLIDQKQSTTVRNRFIGNFNVRMTRFWTLNLNSVYSTLDNQLSDTLAMADNSTVVVRVGQLFGPSQKSVLRSINLDYTFQRTNEKNPSRSDSNLRSHEVTIRLMNALSSSLTLSPSSSVTSVTRGDAGQSTSLTLALSAQWANLLRRQSVNAQASYTGLDGSKVMRVVLRGDYRFVPRIVGRLEFLSTNGRADGDSGNFDEYSGRLSFTYHLGA